MRVEVVAPQNSPANSRLEACPRMPSQVVAASIGHEGLVASLEWCPARSPAGGPASGS